MWVDPRRLKQMLVNLLSNAVKFTPQRGSIGVEVIADDQAKVVRFTVWDTGIGIAAGDIPKLFQAFTQLDSSLSRQQSGTGLGLVLVQRMAELHGGSVTVESEPGKGSRFAISLPWKQAPLGKVSFSDDTYQEPEQNEILVTPHETSILQPNPNTEVALILLAEDNQANILIYSDYLQAKNYRIEVARDGAETITLAEKVAPDLILMDIQMPGINGLEAIRRIRTSEQTRLATVPIIALTALAMPGDRERCLEAGANEYLSKPVRLADLIQTIESYLLEVPGEDASEHHE
jgi:CheY-like chemotaxis protein/anti-sigma regulatory factor (Ser/Thr protein kinase)